MGRAKAWLPFGPETMLARVVRQVSGAVGPIVVVAAPGQELPEIAGRVRIVRDEIRERGPLQGLSAGLAALSDPVEFVFVTSTDVPFLEPAWIGRLLELIGGHELAIPRVDGHLEPLAALYRRAAARPTIEALLRANRLRAALVAEVLSTRIVRPEELLDVDPGLRTLRNLNTPDDYASALFEAGFE